MMRLAITMFMLAMAVPALAHEVRPAYLQMHEDKPGEFQVIWKRPMRGDMQLGLSPEFSGHTENLTPVVTRERHNASVATWRMKSIDPLRGQTIRIAGLDVTMTDVLVRIAFADGTTWTQRLTPGDPAMRIPVRESSLTVAGIYLGLGIEHILTGIDHLLFVLALLIITGGGLKLVKTVTAFTVAHSLTLALATLGFVHVPQQPVEAVIALSIVFVAAEILRSRKGQMSITERAPWIVAFTFGLLHGFGFAGALTEVGLPQGDIPLALLFFNAGVETGQLIFIATVLIFIATGRRIWRSLLPHWAGMIAPYAIGSIAMFWVIQRISLF